MQLKNKLTLSMLSALFFLSCSKKEIQYEDPLLTNRDTTVNPGDDFFNYAIQLMKSNKFALIKDKI